MKRVLIVIACVLILAGPAWADTLTIAAGAGYKKFVLDLAKAYETATGGKTECIFGNMGQIMTQAKGSGAVDVVVGEKGFLEQSGLSFDSFTPLGRGILVVAWPKGKTLASPADVARPDIKRLAMPDPDKAVYGKAGVQYLKAAGLEAAVADKLLVVATVPQVTTYVLSGEVDAGLVNRTDVMDLGEAIGGYLEVDPSLYAPIVIGAGTLAGARDAGAAKSFAAFLATDAAKAVAARHGM